MRQHPALNLFRWHESMKEMLQPNPTKSSSTLENLSNYSRGTFLSSDEWNHIRSIEKASYCGRVATMFREAKGSPLAEAEALEDSMVVGYLRCRGWHCPRCREINKRYAKHDFAVVSDKLQTRDEQPVTQFYYGVVDTGYAHQCANSIGRKGGSFARVRMTQGYDESGLNLAEHQVFFLSDKPIPRCDGTPISRKEAVEKYHGAVDQIQSGAEGEALITFSKNWQKNFLIEREKEERGHDCFDDVEQNYEVFHLKGRTPYDIAEMVNVLGGIDGIDVSGERKSRHRGDYYHVDDSEQIESPILKFKVREHLRERTSKEDVRQMRMNIMGHIDNLLNTCDPSILPEDGKLHLHKPAELDFTDTMFRPVAYRTVEYIQLKEDEEQQEYLDHMKKVREEVIEQGMKPKSAKRKAFQERLNNVLRQFLDPKPALI